MYVSIDSMVLGGFKNGKKHGTWTFFEDISNYNIGKVEEYWFGELISTSNSIIQNERSFEKNDSIIEYSFGPIVKFVLSKIIKHDPNYFFFCELEKDCNSSTTLTFYKLLKTDEVNQIDKFCSLSNRFILLDNLNIPVISEYDREFSNLNWVITHSFYSINLDKFNRIVEVIKNNH